MHRQRATHRALRTDRLFVLLDEKLPLRVAVILNLHGLRERAWVGGGGGTINTDLWRCQPLGPRRTALHRGWRELKQSTLASAHLNNVEAGRHKGKARYRTLHDGGIQCLLRR